LQAVSSRNMYSEHGFDALMRAVFGQVCQSLMVVSYCMPGSPHCQAASAIFRMRSRARYVSHASPFVTSFVFHSLSSTTARMNETGPEAVPPPASGSFDERMLERLEPVPEPNLNSMPSVLARPRIESILSSTELMKHADACGCASIPTLNQTGLLKATFWFT